MKKKAMEISPPSLVVVIVIVLLVLVVILFIFGDQSRKFLENITNIRGGITGAKCEALFSNRRCTDKSDYSCPTKDYDCVPAKLPPTGTKWDCPCVELVAK